MYALCGQSLREDKRSDLLKLIKQDKLKELRKFFDDGQLKLSEFLDFEMLVNEKLDADLFCKSIDRNIYEYVSKNLNRPLSLATMFGSIQLLQYLLPKCTEDHLRNILIALVLGSHLGLVQHSREQKIVHLLERLQTVNPAIDMRSLVLDSVFFNLRPLELALLLGRLGLAKVICELPGVYRGPTSSRKQCEGPLTMETYDFCEYSPFYRDSDSNNGDSRFFLNPLRLLTMVSYQNLATLEISGLAGHPLVSSLLWTLIKRNLPHAVFNIISTFVSLCLYLFFLAPSHYRAIYITIYDNAPDNHTALGSTTRFCNENRSVFTAAAISNRNTNNSNQFGDVPSVFKEWISTLKITDDRPNIIMNCLFSVKYLLDVIVMFWVYWKNKLSTCAMIDRNEFVGTKSKQVMHIYFALYMKTAILLLLLSLWVVLAMEKKSITAGFFWRLQLFDFLNILMAGLLIFDFLYQISVLPRIGSVIQRLLRSFSVFTGMSILYFCSLIVFGTLFFNLMPCLRFKRYVRGNNLISSWIVVFHLNLNIVDFSDEEFERIWILQVFLVLVLPFFVLNFIISVINEEVNTVSSHSDLFSRLYCMNYFLSNDAIFYFPPVRWFCINILKMKPKIVKVLISREI